MRVRRRQVTPWVIVLCVVALTAGACQSQDVTKAALDTDVATVYTNLLAKRDTLLGTPPRTGVQVEANCYRGGPKQPDVGAGKDWRCDVTENDASTAATGPIATTYLVLVRATACWTALAESLSAKAETIDVITMTDPRTGADLPDPLGGFDGCLRA